MHTHTHRAEEQQADCFGSEADTQHFLHSFAPNPSSPSSVTVLKQLLFNGNFSLFQQLCWYHNCKNIASCSLFVASQQQGAWEAKESCQKGGATS